MRFDGTPSWEYELHKKGAARPMRRPKRELMVAAVVAIAGFSAGSLLLNNTAESGPVWACPTESIGHDSITSSASGGYKTALDAAAAWAPVLAEDGGVSLRDLKAGFATGQGPYDYDPKTGRLLIDEKVQAELGVSQLPDGTWAVTAAQYCMRPPEEGDKPGETPSADKG